MKTETLIADNLSILVAQLLQVPVPRLLYASYIDGP